MSGSAHNKGIAGELVVKDWGPINEIRKGQDGASHSGGASDTFRFLQHRLDDLPLVDVDQPLERLAAGLAQKRACQITMTFSNFETEEHAIHIDFIRIGDDGSPFDNY